MQPIETMWLISVGLLIIWALPRLRSLFAARWILLLSLLLAILHLTIEGYRWQLVPAYIVTAISYVVAGIHWWSYKHQEYDRKTGPGRGRTCVAVSARLVGVMLVITSLFLAYTFPVFSLPEPDGPHLVGTTQLDFLDDSRVGYGTETPQNGRRLLVRAWYPRANTNLPADPLPYWPNASIQSQELGNLFGLPGFLFSHLDHVQTHSQIDAPLMQDRQSFPVIIFSHGMFGGPAANTVLVEALASHGYVVFGIDHTYWSLASVFEDGTIATSEQTRTAYASTLAEEEDPKVQAEHDELRNAVSPEQVKASLERIMALTPQQTEFYKGGTKLWSDDQRFLLDILPRLNQNGRFKEKLDLARVGIMGISFGGNATLQTCSSDSRCSAGISLDGFNINAIEIDPLTVPFLYMDSAEHILSSKAHKHVTEVINEGPTYIARVPEAEHFNWSDLMLFTPLFRWIGQLGSIESDRMYSLTNAYVLAFLEHHLRDDGASGETFPNENYPEVELWKK